MYRILPKKQPRTEFCVLNPVLGGILNVLGSKATANIEAVLTVVLLQGLGEAFGDPGGHLPDLRGQVLQGSQHLRRSVLEHGLPLRTGRSEAEEKEMIRKPYLNTNLVGVPCIERKTAHKCTSSEDLDRER